MFHLFVNTVLTYEVLVKVLYNSVVWMQWVYFMNCTFQS
jgi:hypothetical protein